MMFEYQTEMIASLLYKPIIKRINTMCRLSISRRRNDIHCILNIKCGDISHASPPVSMPPAGLSRVRLLALAVLCTHHAQSWHTDKSEIVTKCSYQDTCRIRHDGTMYFGTCIILPSCDYDFDIYKIGSIQTLYPSWDRTCDVQCYECPENSAHTNSLGNYCNCNDGYQGRVEITDGLSLSSTCVYCEPGKYSFGEKNSPSLNIETGVMQCSTCPAGSYSTRGASYCEDCDPMSFSGTGASTCTQCAPGKYSQRGATSCLSCPVNHFVQREERNDFCSECGHNKYVDDAFQCASCDSPKGIKTMSDGARVCAECKVTWAEMEYRDSDGICKDLPVRKIGDDWILKDEDQSWLDGELKDLLAGEYINQNDDGALTSCECSTAFHYASGCGPGAGSADVWVYKFDSNNPNPTVQSLTKIDEGITENDPADYRIYRRGKCLECPTCADGQYSTCAGVSVGSCINCTTSCDPGQYLSLSNPSEYTNSKQWCSWNITDHYPTEDLQCKECPAWKAVDGTYHLVAGCGNVRNFTRWDPSREVTADGTRPRSISCDVGSDNSDCYVSGETVPADEYSAGVDLPYCPPGWHVDETCVQDFKTTWNPACCQRCTTCDLAAGKAVRLHEYAECSGATTGDTQDACADACHVGEYIDGDQCRRCTSCRAGELYSGSDGKSI